MSDATAMTAAVLFELAFEGPRTPRSQSYKDGVLAHLRYRMMETDTCVCPFEAGTAEHDAWYSGFDESHGILSRNKADRRRGA